MITLNTKVFNWYIMVEYKHCKDYKIPISLLNKIKARDKHCVYCHKKLKELPNAIGTPSNKATVEHMDDASVKNPKEWNVTMCCGSCNSSRGPKELLDWFNLKYCKKRNINKSTVAKVVVNYLKKTS